MKRKTHTATEVKRRWNAIHYDKLYIDVPAGAREEIHAAAKLRGMSTAAYIRHLVIMDTAKNPEIAPILRGGGGQYTPQTQPPNG